MLTGLFCCDVIDRNIFSLKTNMKVDLNIMALMHFDLFSPTQLIYESHLYVNTLLLPVFTQNDVAWFPFNKRQ